MALKGVNLTANLKFVSEHDPAKGTPDQTVWHLKPLDAFQVAALNDSLMDFEGIGGPEQNASVNMGRASVLAAQLAIVGHENFQHPETNEDISFEFDHKNVAGKRYKVAADKYISQIPMFVLQEMYSFIQERNGMSPAEAKKSATP